uniref:Proprotein convertase subtilisin/kexin type 5 n=1 Tax=Magallana gigas TaxID=29159 RepID=K1QAL5_MAGGI
MKKTCYKQCPSGLVGYQKKCHLQCPFKARYKYKWECIPQCPKNTLLGFIKYTCFDTCPQGEFKYLQKCVELCPKDAPYDFNGECVKYCAGYLDGFSCYKQCPDKMFAFTGKCIPKCPEEAPFVNIKNCVRTCPYVHDSQLNCMKDCPEQTYPHGKQCKAGCPPDRPFSGPFFDPKCVEKCDNYELATENNKCISRSSCSTFIYGMRTKNGKLIKNRESSGRRMLALPKRSTYLKLLKRELKYQQ